MKLLQVAIDRTHELLTRGNHRLDIFQRLAARAPARARGRRCGGHQADVRMGADLAAQPERVEQGERLDGTIAPVAARILDVRVIARGKRRKSADGEAIADHPWPVVAAINGACLGGGLELAITCDLRICAASAKLGMPPAKLGLIYGHTGLRKFLDTIGLARTKELFLTGRNVDAAKAERIGLVNEVVDDDRLDNESVQLAAAIAANAPLSMRGNKSAINLLNSRPVLSEQQEAGLVALRESCFSSADLREGIRAFAEKRRPKWTGT